MPKKNPMYGGKMSYMKGYGNGYKPPGGTAGGEAHGMFSHYKNPRPVPMRGSQIKSDSQYGMNADRQKMGYLQAHQAKYESLRGYGS